MPWNPFRTSQPERQPAMRASDFTDDPRVVQLVQDLETYWYAERPEGRYVSDIVDEEGHQYVDLVMEGGGVLGVALLGYTYALEQLGIRFLSIGGTSAGSIGALLLAAVDDKERPKSPRIVEHLANQNLYDFVDGPDSARRLINAALKKAGKLRLGAAYLFAHNHFFDHLGLNPGDAFLAWVREILADAGIRTNRDLERRMAHVPDGLRMRGEKSLAQPEERARLAIISAEVGTETKVEFPRMAPLFWHDPEQVNPACFVRASMSVPFFFYPYRLPVPQGAEAGRLWHEEASYRQPLPKEAFLIDGGIMSNFPIDVFHEPTREPSAPTFGVKLGQDDRRAQRVAKPHHLGLAAFNAARHCLDYDFLIRNPDYNQLVAYVNTRSTHDGTGTPKDEKYNWLDFSLCNAAKVDLFYRGVEAAARFLGPKGKKGPFDWEAYKAVRRDLAAAYRQDGAPGEAAPA